MWTIYIYYTIKNVSVSRFSIGLAHLKCATITCGVYLLHYFRCERDIRCTYGISLKRQWSKKQHFFPVIYYTKQQQWLYWNREQDHILHFTPFNCQNERYWHFSPGNDLLSNFVFRSHKFHCVKSLLSLTFSLICITISHC